MHINEKTVVFVLMVAVALWYVLLLKFSPLPLHVIDRDKSGIVSFIEALDSADIGKRAVDGKPNCIEYFWFKDGLPAYESCTNVNNQKL
ncbi:MAG: hypothetical protein ACXW0Q_15940 [Methylovulum sp.]